LEEKKANAPETFIDPVVDFAIKVTGFFMVVLKFGADFFLS